MKLLLQQLLDSSEYYAAPKLEGSGTLKIGEKG